MKKLSKKKRRQLAIDRAKREQNKPKVLEVPKPVPEIVEDTGPVEILPVYDPKTRSTPELFGKAHCFYGDNGSYMNLVIVGDYAIVSAVERHIKSWNSDERLKLARNFSGYNDLYWDFEPSPQPVINWQMIEVEKQNLSDLSFKIDECIWAITAHVSLPEVNHDSKR